MKNYPYERYMIGRCLIWPVEKARIDIHSDIITQQGDVEDFTIATLPDFDFTHDNDKAATFPYGMQKHHASLIASAQDMFEVLKIIENGSNIDTLLFAKAEAKKVLAKIEADREYIKDIYEYKQKTGWNS